MRGDVRWDATGGCAGDGRIWKHVGVEVGGLTDVTTILIASC